MSEEPRWPVAAARTAAASPAPALGGPATRRSPEQLVQDATAIHRLLADLDEDDHELRIALLEARLQVRYEAALAWHGRGWRSIGDAGPRGRRLSLLGRVRRRLVKLALRVEAALESRADRPDGG